MSLRGFLRGAPARPNPRGEAVEGWRVDRRTTQPGEAWTPVREGIESLADARAEVQMPAPPIEPGDLVRLLRPGHRREHWFLPEDGSEAVWLPPTHPAPWLRSGRDDVRRVVASDWAEAWEAVDDGPWMLGRLAPFVGSILTPQRLVRLGLDVFERRRELLGIPGNGAPVLDKGIVRAAVPALGAWCAQGTPIPATQAWWARQSERRVTGTDWVADAARALLKAAVRGSLTPEGTGALEDVWYVGHSFGRVAERAGALREELAAQAALVRVHLPLQAVLAAIVERQRSPFPVEDPRPAKAVV